jgi:hypothetical protein
MQRKETRTYLQMNERLPTNPEGEYFALEENADLIQELFFQVLLMQFLICY